MPFSVSLTECEIIKYEILNYGDDSIYTSEIENANDLANGILNPTSLIAIRGTISSTKDPIEFKIRITHKDFFT